MTETPFYIYRDQTKYGPYTWNEIWHFAQIGNLAADDLLWSSELKDWTRVDAIDSLKAFCRPPVPPPVIVEPKKKLFPYVIIWLLVTVTLLGLGIMVTTFFKGPRILDYFPKEAPAGARMILSLSKPFAPEDLQVSFGGHSLSMLGYDNQRVSVSLPLNANSGDLQVSFKGKALKPVPVKILKPVITLLHEENLKPQWKNQTVRTESGIEVTVPGGLLKKTRTLHVSQISNPAVFNDDPFEKTDVISVSIDGLEQLDDYIEIGIPYDAALLDPSLPAEAQFTPARWDDENKVWVDLYYRVDDTEGMVYLITDHLSYFLTGFSLVGLAKTAGIVVVAGSVLGETAERWANDKYLSRGWKIRVLYSDSALRSVFPDDEWKKVISRAKLHLTDNYDSKYSCAVQDIAHIFEESLNRYVDAGFPDPTKKGIWGAHIYTRYVKVKIDSYYNYTVQQGELAHETFWDTIHIPTEIIKLEFFNPVKENPSTFEQNFVFLKSGLAHELFHAFQRPYYGLSIAFLETKHKWWREATAEWCGQDLARIPYRSGWDKDEPNLLTRLGNNFLREPINSIGKKAGTCSITGGLDYEYLAAIFVRFLVREKGFNLKQTIETIAKSGRKADPLVPLRSFIKNQKGMSMDRLYLEFAAWLLDKSEKPISSFQDPASKNKVAEKCDTLTIAEETANLRLSQDSKPSLERVLVYKSKLGQETIGDHLKPAAVLEKNAPDYVELKVEDGDVLYFLAANGLDTERRTVFAIERRERGTGTELDSWKRAVSYSMALKADGTAGIWAVRISTGNLKIEPDEIESANGFEEYEFRVSADKLSKEIQQVNFKFDFGDNLPDSKGQVQVDVVDGQAQTVLTHRYEPSPGLKPEDKALTYQLQVDMLHQDQSMGSAQAGVTVAKAEVVIQPPRAIVLELSPGATEANESFQAIAQPAGSWQFDWNFDDGQTYSDLASSNQSLVSHTFKGLKGGTTFNPQVSLVDPYGKVWAQDRISVSCTEPGGNGKWVLIDKKVKSVKAGMVGAEPGESYWKISSSSATVDFPEKESGGPPKKKWERTVNSRFRYLFSNFPNSFSPQETISLQLKVEDNGSKASYSKGSHSLKLEVDPFLNDSYRASLNLAQGGAAVQYPAASVSTQYEVAKNPPPPSEKNWDLWRAGSKIPKEGDIMKVSMRLELTLTWTVITYTYQYTEH